MEADRIKGGSSEEGQAGCGPSRWIRLLLSLRFIPVVLLVLPASLLLRQYRNFVERRRVLQQRTGAASLCHANAVAQVQTQLRMLHGKKGPGLCSARPARDQMTMRVVEYKNARAAVDLSALDGVIGINPTGTTVAVEPGCTVLRLTSFLMPRGYTLLVTPELDELTIGGLLAGYGIESSSHVHGLFFDCVESCDVVVASGELVHW